MKRDHEPMSQLPVVIDNDFTFEMRDASPAHLLVKIESFSSRTKHGIHNYESDEFVAGDYKWKLVINFDREESEQEDDHISVYLSMVEDSVLPAGWEVHAMFNIFLYNHKQDNYLCMRGKAVRFHQMKSKWGFSKVMSTENLTNPCNGYIFNDTCVFGAEVFVITRQRVIERVSLSKDAAPHKHDWKISQFSQLKDLTNEEFAAAGYKWKILLYPNGNGSGVGRFISIYVELVESRSFAPHQKVKANIIFRIKNKLNNIHHTKNLSGYWYTSSSPNWGYHEFISIADMRDPSKGFVVDDCCHIETEISVLAHVRDATKCST